MMKTSYDPEADAFAAWFAPEGMRSERIKEVAPGVFVDFNADGGAVGVEVLSVGLRVSGAYGAVQREHEAAG